MRVRLQIVHKVHRRVIKGTITLEGTVKFVTRMKYKTLMISLKGVEKIKFTPKELKIIRLNLLKGSTRGKKPMEMIG